MELTLKLDTRSKDGKTLIDFLKNLSYVEVITPKKVYPISKNIPNTETRKAIDDAKRGIGLNKVKNSKELFKQLGI